MQVIPSAAIFIQGHIAPLSSQEPWEYADIKHILRIIGKSHMAVKTHGHQRAMSSDTHKHERL